MISVGADGNIASSRHFAIKCCRDTTVCPWAWYCATNSNQTSGYTCRIAEQVWAGKGIYQNIEGRRQGCTTCDPGNHWTTILGSRPTTSAGTTHSNSEGAGNRNGINLVDRICNDLNASICWGDNSRINFRSNWIINITICQRYCQRTRNTYGSRSGNNSNIRINCRIIIDGNNNVSGSSHLRCRATNVGLNRIIDFIEWTGSTTGQTATGWSGCQSYWNCNRIGIN